MRKTPTTPKFQAGDRVQWTSSAAGTTKTKVGRVIEVVPPQRKPRTPMDIAATWRDHESYVVEVVVARNGRPKRTLYWPRVAALARALLLLVGLVFWGCEAGVSSTPDGAIRPRSVPILRGEGIFVSMLECSEFEWMSERARAKVTCRMLWCEYGDRGGAATLWCDSLDGGTP